MQTYLIQGAVGLTLFYAIYYFVMRKETNFALMRFYLLSSIAFAFLIPMLDFSFLFAQESQFSEVISPYILNADLLTGGALSASKSISWIAIVYFAGVGFLALRFLLQISLIISMITGNEKINYGKYTIVVLKNKKAAFSFGNYIFLDKETYNSENSEGIINHEIIHSSQKHSFDLLLLEMITIFQWWNPIVWLYKKTLKETHEYLADAGVLEQGYSHAEYELLLVKQAVGYRLGIANNLNKSFTLKRLQMMKRVEKSNMAHFKALLAVPVIAVLVFAFACNKTEISKVGEGGETFRIIKTASGQEYKFAPQSKEAEEIMAKIENEDVISDAIFENGETTYWLAEKMPEYPGGFEALKMFISENVKYPEKAKEDEITGKVFIRFAVNEDGSVGSAEIARKVDPLLDAEALRVINMMPDWTPGEADGKAVAVYFTIPINFALEDK